MSVLHKHSLRLTPYIQHMCSHSFIRVMSTYVPFTSVLAIMWLQLCISSFLYVHVDTCSIHFDSTHRNWRGPGTAAMKNHQMWLERYLRYSQLHQSLSLAYAFTLAWRFNKEHVFSFNQTFQPHCGVQQTLYRYTNSKPIIVWQYMIIKLSYIH